MLSEKLEEILESVWTAGENKNYSVEAIRKDCAVDFVEADLDALEAQGLIVRSSGKVLFSGEGKKVAEGIIRRHRLAEVLVTSILNINQADVEEVACKVEHGLLPEVEESICTLLGHPDICPDGKPIPMGRCCADRRKVVNNVVVSLAELKPSERGRITYIKPASHSSFRQLISFGLHPGVVVTVHRTQPAFCVKFEQTELALDKEIAGNIFVWRINNNQVS